jgi:hypothetical protein
MKKFPSLVSELDALEDQLKENPEIGESLGGGLFKLRLASRDKGKGKSGGFRIITYLVSEQLDSKEIFLVVIYDKSEEGSIKKHVLVKYLKTLFG